MTESDPIPAHLIELHEWTRRMKQVAVTAFNEGKTDNDMTGEFIHVQVRDDLHIAMAPFAPAILGASEITAEWLPLVAAAVSPSSVTIARDGYNSLDSSIDPADHEREWGDGNLAVNRCTVMESMDINFTSTLIVHNYTVGVGHKVVWDDPQVFVEGPMGGTLRNRNFTVLRRCIEESFNSLYSLDIVSERDIPFGLTGAETIEETVEQVVDTLAAVFPGPVIAGSELPPLD